MSKERKVELGSRWLSRVDGKTVMVVMERKPFGKLYIKREDRHSYGDTDQRRLLANFTLLEGRSEAFRALSPVEM